MLENYINKKREKIGHEGVYLSRTISMQITSYGRIVLLLTRWRPIQLQYSSEKHYNECQKMFNSQSAIYPFPLKRI